MSDDTTDESGIGRTESDTDAASSTYKVLGELEDASGAGVLGRNTAGSGTPIGVEGAVPNASGGYGLYTDHDAMVGGTLAAGTIDTAEEDFRVEAGTTATSDATNVLLGHTGNTVGDNAVGVTIAGGGYNDGNNGSVNIVLDNYGSVGGGRGNQIGEANPDPTDATFGTIGGGEANTALGSHSTIGGGRDNKVTTTPGGTVAGGTSNAVTATKGVVGGGLRNTAGDTQATVAGGLGNEASGSEAFVGGGQDNVANSRKTVVAGGWDNTASGWSAVVGGGLNNEATNSWSTISGGEGNFLDANHTTVSGGKNNNVEFNSAGATVGGGRENFLDNNNEDATIGGGTGNKIYDRNGPATISGGTSNAVTATRGTVGGGQGNTAGGADATVGGGTDNDATGTAAAVPGGADNAADGAYSVAAGRNAAAGGYDGTFVFGDSTSTTVQATSPDQVVFQAGGSRTSGTAVEFHSQSDGSAGVKLAANDGTWQSVSARAAKTDVDPVDGPEVLEAVERLPISTWRYDGQDESVRHMGPMAGEFHDAFGLGTDEETVAALDLAGVALAAIKGLARELDARDERIETLAAENETLRERVDDLERLRARVRDLEADPGAGETAADSGEGETGAGPGESETTSANSAAADD